MNLMSTIPWLPQEESVYKVKIGRPEFTILMRLEQTITEWMRDIVQKLTKRANLSVDVYVETFLPQRPVCLSGVIEDLRRA